MTRSEPVAPGKGTAWPQDGRARVSRVGPCSRGEGPPPSPSAASTLCSFFASPTPNRIPDHTPNQQPINSPAPGGSPTDKKLIDSNCPAYIAPPKKETSTLQTFERQT